MKKLNVTIENANEQLQDFYFCLACYREFYTTLESVFNNLNDIKNSLLSKNLIFGRGASHIWISDEKTGKRFVIITEQN